MGGLQHQLDGAIVMFDDVVVAEQAERTRHADCARINSAPPWLGSVASPARACAATAGLMKQTAAAILVIWATASHAEILCQDAAGHEPGAYWSWREIDGKRCWFKRQGAMPPKSQLRWGKQEAKPKLKDEAAPAPAEHEPPAIRMLRTQVLREGMSEMAANWIDGDAPVDLMRGDALSGPGGVGGSWVVPPYEKNTSDATSFGARFAPLMTPTQARAK